MSFRIKSLQKKNKERSKSLQKLLVSVFLSVIDPKDVKTQPALEAVWVSDAGPRRKAQHRVSSPGHISLHKFLSPPPPPNFINNQGGSFKI